MDTMEIDVEFGAQFEAVDQHIEELQHDIKVDVINARTTVKGDNLMAIYSERNSWNTELLEGLGMVIPQVLDARKVTESVTIRKR